VVRQGETKGPIDSVPDADARRYQHFAYGKAVVLQLQRGCGVEQVKSVMGRAREAESLAQAARPGGELPGFRAGGKTAIQRHLIQAQLSYWFKSAEQDAPGPALGFTSDIHAEVAAVDCIDIRMARRTKDNEIAGRGTAMGVSGGVGRAVVGTQVGLHLNDSPSQQAGARGVHKHFAQQARRHLFRQVLKEGTGKQGARQRRERAG